MVYWSAKLLNLGNLHLLFRSKAANSVPVCCSYVAVNGAHLLNGAITATTNGSMVITGSVVGVGNYLSAFYAHITPQYGRSCWEHLLATTKQSFRYTNWHDCLLIIWAKIPHSLEQSLILNVQETWPAHSGTCSNLVCNMHSFWRTFLLFLAVLKISFSFFSGSDSSTFYLVSDMTEMLCAGVGPIRVPKPSQNPLLNEGPGQIPQRRTGDYSTAVLSEDGKVWVVAQWASDKFTNLSQPDSGNPRYANWGTYVMEIDPYVLS